MRYLAYLLMVLAGACADSGPCSSDGTCDPHATCGAPDPDCFTAYPDSASAQLAIGSGLSAPPARYEALANRAWQMLGDEVSLGDIADAHITVAYSAGEREWFGPFGSPNPHIPLTLPIDRAWDSMPDGQILADMLHVLAHLARLDPVHGDEEPSYEILDVTGQYDVAHAQAAAWLDGAALAGLSTEPALLGMPLSDDDGLLAAAVPRALGDGCGGVYDDLRSAQRDVGIDGVTQGYELDAAQIAKLAGLVDRVRPCDHGQSLSSFLYGKGGSALDSRLFASMTPGEKPLLDQPAIAGLLALIDHRRTAMRAAIATFTATTGAPWSALRIRTHADAADELAISVGASHALPDGGVAAALRAHLPDDEARTACDAAIASGSVPYGVDLAADHHAPCWRIARAMGVAR